MCRVTKLDRKGIDTIRGATKVEEISKNIQQMRLTILLTVACDAKREALRGKEGVVIDYRPGRTRRT